MVNHNVDITVTLQGSGRTDNGYYMPIIVKFYDNSTGVSGALLYNTNENSTKDGSTAKVQATGIPPDTYDIYLVSPHCLTNVKKA